MNKFLMIIFVMFLLVSVAHGEAYKWIDEQEQVHYSDKPPNGPCEEIKAPECPSEEDIQVMQDRLERKKRLLREYDEKRDQERKQAERAKEEREKRAILCEEAKKKLRFLEESKGMRMAREGSEGELHWMSDEEREKTENYWRKRVERFCE
jgi:hypothetical protein